MGSIDTQTLHGTLNLDAVIIGAGFSGIYLLRKLRDDLKMNVKIFETASDIGGTWYWNRYPGARVDSPAPSYGFTSEKTWKSWIWTEKYPDQKELKAYFDHLDRELGIRKDCFFNSEVIGATFDTGSCKWTVKTKDGKSATASHIDRKSVV